MEKTDSLINISWAPCYASRKFSLILILTRKFCTLQGLIFANQPYIGILYWSIYFQELEKLTNRFTVLKIPQFIFYFNMITLLPSTQIFTLCWHFKTRKNKFILFYFYSIAFLQIIIFANGPFKKHFAKSYFCKFDQIVLSN